MRLKISDSYYISDFENSDKAALIEYLGERQIYEQTLNIPYPYSERDADAWVALVTAETAKLGQSVNWAIREETGKLIGGVGFHNLDSKNPHRAEIGYWLAKPYWRKGIMGDVVKVVTAFAFDSLGFSRITAGVFASNVGSAKVLEKNGFVLEGKLREHYQKDGKIFDGLIYAKIKVKN